MTAKILTKDRQARSEANRAFPGDGSMVARTIPTMADVRNGSAEIASVPWVLPINREIFQRRQTTLRENRFDRSNPDHVREYANLIRSSYQNPAAAAELASYRTFELTNDIMASPFALSAFQDINLSADELPLLTFPRSRNLQRFTVRSQSLDGGARSAQWIPGKAISQIEMEMLASDKVEYTIWDLQQGNVSAVDDINRELNYDFDMKIDGLALAQVQAAKTVSGLRALLSIHPLVVQANIPDTNYLDLTNVSFGVANTFTIERMKAVLNHIALFGAAEPSQALSISNIILSPQNMRDPWDYVSLVSGYDSSATFGANNPKNTVPNSVRESIFSGGMLTSAWGYNWSWQPNSQIAKGKMYVFTNQPLGWRFTKSEFDKIISYDASNSPQHAEHNIGEVMLQKAMVFYIPDLWKYRTIEVDF